MRVITGTNTAEQFHTWIEEQRDSHVAVLLRSGQRAEDFWESGAVTELRLHCQVEKLVWKNPEELADRLRACKWREPADRVYQSKQVESARTCLCATDRLLAFGGLYELQEICVARALWLKGWH